MTMPLNQAYLFRSPRNKRTKKKLIQLFHFKFNLFGFLFLLISISSFSQPVKVSFESDTLIISLHPSSKTYADSTSLAEDLRTWRFGAIKKGYLEASADTFNYDSSRAGVYLHYGPKYHWAQLKNGNIREEILSSIGFREKFYANKQIKPRELANIIEKILVFQENRGYPFSQVYLDSISTSRNKLTASIFLMEGPFIVLDSLIIKGPAKINQKFIKNYLGIKPGMPYNENKIKNSNRLLKSLPFLTPVRQPEILFHKESADLYLYLENKKASNFNGILGFLPDPQTGDLLLTGDVRLVVVNAFERGESLNFNWRKLQDNTQELNANISYPYLLNTPIGTEGAINLYRRDTLFSQTTLKAGLLYSLGGLNNFKINITSNRNSILSQDFIDQNDFGNSRSLLYGIGFHFENLDYKFNPQKGFLLDTEASAGKKTITPHPDALEEYYEDVALESTILNLQADVFNFIQLLYRTTLMTRVQGAWLINDELFRNELFRIGGLRNLRGVDDQSIFASGFLTGTVELRYLLEQNSNIFVFFDAAYYEDKSREQFISDTPIGFGAGISFETAAGIFSLTYALGQQFNNPIEFRSAKIHFGFTSLF